MLALRLLLLVLDPRKRHTAADAADRDDWLNRFALGQLKNRIMTSTGTAASANDPHDWVCFVPTHDHAK